ncbi:MAG: sialate O-acetylesterase [Planctomycetota bacterium]
MPWIQTYSAQVLSLLLLFVIAAMPSSVAFGQDKESNSVKVFILAGQSNMEGKAPNALFEHQATDAKTKSLFTHLRDENGWVTRDDVWIKYLGRHGGLTLGYGTRDRTGLELEFGTVLGNHFEEPVLLIKTCWGGHSLFRNFRPPSAGMPADETLQEEWERAKTNKQKQNEKRNRNDALPTMDEITTVYGSSYRNMLQEVKEVQKNYETLFPELKGKQLEISGFVWFQGWNDQYGGAEQEYETNMKHLINDIRKDLGVKKMPVVIGLMGQNGSKPAKGPMLAIQQAQMAMMSVNDFQGNVVSIRTDELVDKAAEELYPEWKERFEEWKLVGGDRPYHYLGSAIWFNRIGNKMAKSMIELME